MKHERFKNFSAKMQAHYHQWKNTSLRIGVFPLPNSVNYSVKFVIGLPWLFAMLIKEGVLSLTKEGLVTVDERRLNNNHSLHGRVQGTLYAGLLTAGAILSVIILFPFHFVGKKLKQGYRHLFDKCHQTQTPTDKPSTFESSSTASLHQTMGSTPTVPSVDKDIELKPLVEITPVETVLASYEYDEPQCTLLPSP